MQFKSKRTEQRVANWQQFEANEQISRAKELITDLFAAALLLGAAYAIMLIVFMLGG